MNTLNTITNKYDNPETDGSLSSSSDEEDWQEGNNMDRICLYLHNLLMLLSCRPAVSLRSNSFCLKT